MLEELYGMSIFIMLYSCCRATIVSDFSMATEAPDQVWFCSSSTQKQYYSIPCGFNPSSAFLIMGYAYHIATLANDYYMAREAPQLLANMESKSQRKLCCH
ncbi:hypothetical protein Tco_1453465, partial [Tanacetum coccineum]